MYPLPDNSIIERSVRLVVPFKIKDEVLCRVCFKLIVFRLVRDGMGLPLYGAVQKHPAWQ